MVALALERFVDYASPEGMKRLDEKAKQPPTEEDKKHNAEREGYDVTANRTPPQAPVNFVDVGFGKAKKELDWIDPSKKMN
jgi:hypothetical protein